MADGDVTMLAERDAQFALERERLKRDEPSPAAASLLAVIERAQSAAVASDEEIRAMEARLAREAWRDRLRNSGINDSTRAEDRKRILDDSLDATPALRAVKAWLARATAHPPGRNMLVLCGERGLGKTVAAAWAITRCGGVYAKVDEYLRDYDRWQRDRSRSDEASAVLRRYKRAHLVVLDEVGRERDANVMRDAFYKLVDERQSRRRELTIMLTNLSKHDFIGRLERGIYDERACDRMKRDAWVVGLDGESMRKGAW